MPRSHGAKVTINKFYVAEDGAPLRLHMDGNDMFSGAHFDEYIADYEYLKAGPVDAAVFEPPAICDGQQEQILARPPAFPLRMAALLPSVRIGTALKPFLLKEQLTDWTRCPSANDNCILHTLLLSFLAGSDTTGYFDLAVPRALCRPCRSAAAHWISSRCYASASEGVRFMSYCRYDCTC